MRSRLFGGTRSAEIKGGRALSENTVRDGLSGEMITD